MSSSSVYQGLQSCLEPRLMEPRVLRLKLTPSKSKFSPLISPSPESHTHNEEKNNTTIIKTNNKNNEGDLKLKSEDIGGWSFLQCLNNTKETADDDNEKVYVHPLVKRPVLSDKSLELCTESLGSETGCLVSADDITTIPSPEITTQLTLRNSLVSKRTNRSVSFPPPLTSIIGVHVRPHREGGRLVLQASTVSSSPTYFHTERSDGRLRLCLVKDDDEEDEDEESDGEDKVCCDNGEDVEGISAKVRGEIGIEKLPRPSKCKEGGRGAGNKLIWEPFWVTT